MKRYQRLAVLLLCISLLFAAFALPVSAGRKDTLLPGDLNGDGQRTAIDYIMLKRHVLGTYRIPDASLPAADINGNGEPDALDYMLLKRALLGTYVLPDAPQDPSELPEDLLYAVAFSYLFRTANHEVLLRLEGSLGVAPETLNQLVVTYLAALSIDGEELLALENQFSFDPPTAGELESFLQNLASWLETLLPEKAA